MTAVYFSCVTVLVPPQSSAGGANKEVKATTIKSCGLHYGLEYQIGAQSFWAWQFPPFGYTHFVMGIFLANNIPKVAGFEYTLKNCVG
jgi:hypothetical protein